MTAEMYNHCRKELEDALASKDEMRIKAAEGRILTGIMECQYKTSDRVKKMVADIAEIMQDHGAMLKSHHQYQEDRAERRGAKKMLQLIKWAVTIIGSGGLGAGAMKFLSSIN